MRILLVEDSDKLRRAIGLRLRKQGWVLDATGDGAEGLWLAQGHDYDAIILDRMLPGLDGLTVLRKLRAQKRDTPVLILTVKGTVEDRVCGLQEGADDYLTKPFAMEELLARVEALGRRRYARPDPVLRFGRLEVDTRARAVCLSGRPLALRPREYRLLELLARRAGEVVSRAEIEERIYQDAVEVFSNTVDSAICTLRRKLEQAGCPPLIQTRRGMGYCLQWEGA